MVLEKKITSGESLVEKESLESQKNEEKKKVIEETRNELNQDEFYYLKESTRQFDILKKNIEKLPQLNPKFKERIIKKLEEEFYLLPNNRGKLEVIKKLNEMFEEVILKYQDDPIKMKEELSKYIDYLNSQEPTSVAVGKSIEGLSMLVSVLGVFVFILGAIAASPAAPTGALISGFGGIGTIFGDAIWKGESEFNKLFDILNDLFPQISKEEWRQIIKAIINNKITEKELIDFISIFYGDDGKITPEERKKIDEFLKKLNS